MHLYPLVLLRRLPPPAGGCTAPLAQGVQCLRGLRVTTPLLALPPHVPAGLPFRRHGGLCASDASTGSEVLLIAAAGYHSHAVVASRGIFSAPYGRLPEVEVQGSTSSDAASGSLRSGLRYCVVTAALHSKVTPPPSSLCSSLCVVLLRQRYLTRYGSPPSASTSGFTTLCCVSSPPTLPAVPLISLGRLGRPKVPTAGSA